MSAQPSTPSPVRVEVAGQFYAGRFRTDRGILTVWYGNWARSVALRYEDPEFQAKLLLTQMAMDARQPDPRD